MAGAALSASYAAIIISMLTQGIAEHVPGLGLT